MADQTVEVSLTAATPTFPPVPDIYKGTKPIVNTESLSPLQLALATYMAQGTPITFGPNQNFLRAMMVFSSSQPLSPLEFDPVTGAPRIPDLNRTLVGFNYVTRGPDIYLFRRAADCGPSENRTELVFIGNQTTVATGTWTMYTPRTYSGSVADASALGYGPGDGAGTGGDGGGGCGSSGGGSCS